MSRFAKVGLRPEYFEMVDGITLDPLRLKQSVEMGSPIVVCTAVFAGDVRLIDNVVLHF
jgi:pantothenate synthetase